LLPQRASEPVSEQGSRPKLCSGAFFKKTCRQPVGIVVGDQNSMRDELVGDQNSVRAINNLSVQLDSLSFNIALKGFSANQIASF
jgi:hypothetical protein